MPTPDPRLARIPHLRQGDVVIRHDIGDSIARRAGMPMFATACGEQIVGTLTTKLPERVRCDDCKTAMTSNAERSDTHAE